MQATKRPHSSMAALALPLAAAGRRPSVAAAASSSRLLLGQRPFLASSASRFAAGHAAVPRPLLSVVAMADKYPIMGVVIELRDKTDAEKMENGLVKLAHEDALFQFSMYDDEEVALIKGMGESQLDTIVDRLKGEFKSFGMSTKRGGGRISFADVTLRLEPMKAGSGYEFKNEMKEGAMPKQFVKGVKKGIENNLPKGIVAYYPAVDLRAVLVDGSYRDVFSSFRAFETAAGIAFRQALKKDGPGLLKPVMRVEVITPEEYLNTVLVRLVSGRGEIKSIEDKRDGLQVVDAFVPLASMFLFASTLNALSKGSASHTMQVAKFVAVPQDIQNLVLARARRGF